MKTDLFPCGLMITSLHDQTILHTNQYFDKEFGYTEEALISQPVSYLFTRASIIFLENYLYPMLIQDRVISEIQIMLVTADKNRIPVTVNATLDEDNLVRWALFCSINRDKLYQELIDTKNKLEQQTQELTILSSTDDLTGLLNRREASNRANKMIEQTKRNDIALSFVLLDIDFFKKINDTYGHQEGDRVLVELAKELENTARSCDIVSRWGGEEFLIVLYNTPTNQAQAFCQRLHQAIDMIKVGKETLKVSIGVSCYQKEIQDNQKIDSIIRQADNALYCAKQKGRNQTYVF